MKYTKNLNGSEAHFANCARQLPTVEADKWYLLLSARFLMTIYWESCSIAVSQEDITCQWEYFQQQHEVRQ